MEIWLIKSKFRNNQSLKSDIKFFPRQKSKLISLEVLLSIWSKPKFWAGSLREESDILSLRSWLHFCWRFLFSIFDEKSEFEEKYDEGLLIIQMNFEEMFLLLQGLWKETCDLKCWKWVFWVFSLKIYWMREGERGKINRDWSRCPESQFI